MTAARSMWHEAVSAALEEVGLQATDEQITNAAEGIRLWIECERETSYHPPNPLSGEVSKLRAELEAERRKVWCKTCAGTGRIVSYGPVHSAESNCWKCRGHGRVAP